MRAVPTEPERQPTGPAPVRSTEGIPPGRRPVVKDGRLGYLDRGQFVPVSADDVPDRR